MSISASSAAPPVEVKEVTKETLKLESEGETENRKNACKVDDGETYKAKKIHSVWLLILTWIRKCLIYCFISDESGV